MNWRWRGALIVAVALSVGLFLLHRLNLVFFALHQLYYAPLGSWLGLPFFQPDSEVGFFALWPGRILTAFIYSVVWVGIFRLFQRRIGQADGSASPVEPR